MEQGKGIPDQDLNPGISRGMDDTLDEKTAQQGRTAAEHVDDYDQNYGDADVNVKQFLDQTEYIDNRGPLGTGD